MSVCVCVCTTAGTVLFHYTAVSRLTAGRPRRSRHRSSPCVRWRTEQEAQRREKVDLLATINIKLLYKAPVDNIKGAC